MSGVNPAAAAAAAASAAEAALALELQQLAADAQALRAMLMEGDVVQATVQPFNGMTDVLEIFGLRVAASLPPNVHPGDTLTVAVQGFQNDQVMVQVLTTTPSQPQTRATAPAAPTLPPPPVPAGDTLELTPTPVPIVAPQPPPAANAPSAAPQTANESPASPAPPPLQSPGPPSQPAPAQVFATAARPVPTEPQTLTVEARLALARTAATLVPPPAQNNAARAPRTAPPQAAVVRGQAPAQAASAVPPRASAPPPFAANVPQAPYVPIAPRAPAQQTPGATPLPGAPAQVRSTTMVPPSQVQVTVPDVGELLGDPVQLLRSLRIPVTPTALTFAKLVTTQPQQVATALRALESGLPASDDPRITTLRTLAAFVGNLDPKAETFTTQIVSYLSHVVEGPEPKLLPVVQPQSAPAEAQAQPQAAPATPAPQTETAVAARTVERLAAVDADLKTQLVGLLARAQPEAALGDTGTVLARNALTALVATQLGTLAGQQSQPPAWTFTIPIAVDQQLYPAQVKVSRDKPEGEGEALTGDDFHMAFILDTKRFGTVGIDVHSVQRSVSVAVRTERPSAATTFKSALASLGDRLQSMRYNVKSLEAGTTKTPAVSLSNETPPSDELHAMDRKA